MTIDRAGEYTKMSLSSSKLKSSYQNLLHDVQTLFPKVDQKLVLDILHLEGMYKDWEGSVMLKVVYPAGTNLEAKKELIFKRYQRVPSMEEDRVLRFKVMRMYIDELDKLLIDDPQIEYVTGSATLTPSDAYSA